MASPKIIPVILSGGAGTRLWPLSRSGAPKQLLSLVASESLIQATALRTAKADGFDAPIVVAGAAHGAEIERQLAAVGCPAQRLILEPTGRNTAPAIALAALAALEIEPDALILIMPSDQVIARPEAFLEAAIAAAGPAMEGWLLTFGIAPDRPETGYGYIEAGGEIVPGVRGVARFVEKPDLATARDYLESGRFFWNAGIFLMRADACVAALERHAPGIAAAARRAYESAGRDGTRITPTPAAFSASPSDSIDYAVMEKAKRVAVVPVDMGWSDIGAFAALWEQLPRDDAGNAVQGDVIAHDTANCLLKSEGPLLAAVGVSELSVIATHDAVLVLPHARAQEVKRVVDHLKRTSRPELDRAPMRTEAWGFRRRLAEGTHAGAQLYEIAAGRAAELPGVPGSAVTLLGGGATLAGQPLAPAEATPLTGTALLQATGDTPARILLTTPSRRS